MAKNYVCNGAKIECMLCTLPEGELKVTSNTVKVQDKLFANANDKERENLVFQGNCKKSPAQAHPCQMVINTGDWENIADLVVQDAPALLEDSTIKCNYGGVAIKITDHLQINEITSIQPATGPFIEPIFEPEILSLEWKSNKEVKDKNKTSDHPDGVIEETTAGEKIWLEACTLGMLPGETVTFEIVEKDDPKTILLHSTGYIDTEGYARIELQSEDAIDIVKQTLCATVTYYEQKKEARITLAPKLPKLQGEIIFVHGFLSDPIHNSEAVFYNATKHKNPDDPNSGALKGENADENDRTHPDDIDTAQEKRDRDNAPEKSRKEKIMDFLKNPLRDFAFTPDEKYYDYWNTRANDFKATKTYAKYFNAEDHVHYINGSHGLGSNGAHRVDHGISLGYTWAEEVYTLLECEDVEEFKDEIPIVEQYSPKYKPITVIGHSQGVCMAAGVALGVIKYAADKGYDTIPINIIFLGVHQPRGLYGKEYDHLIDVKVDRYELNYSYPSFGDDEESSFKFLNSLSALFSDKYKKLYHNRGLYEHVKEISDWQAYKTRAVQFTFTNDHGDLVLIDGDIPEIPSACDPKRDSTLFSVEYYGNLPTAIHKQNKEIINLTEHGAKGGFIVLPKYIANNRFDFDALKEIDKPTKTQLELGVEWAKYKTVAIRWGTAMYNYKKLKKQYETQTGKSYRYTNKVAEEYQQAMQKLGNWLKDKNPFTDDLTDEEKRKLEERKKELDLKTQVTDAFETALKKYAAIQEADLYAHFSPVEMIHHPKMVENFPNDALGNESIWKRIQNLGKDIFYRVEYDTDPKKVAEMTEQQKREKEREEIEGKLVNKLVDTSIGDTDYINNVIQAYVHQNKDAEYRLYQEAKDEQ
ncbi:DUF4280 domain-containing protein [Flagellimonas marinaquae]|uniref:DUF4280 domain-containing protein n=1 Tax=Flagellimonas marinaquae TaxID=254955 RepID=UPI0020760472|nr:DUF4280 domain-containing protein [Allomuricauda aquimarina]USD26877.1 DUF4280 domain-containing protein [Allomuricauda aquimarina]